jgi:hypothetical protein
MPDPHLRAADTDRQAAATRLGQHMSDGRLTVEEYDERLAAAYAARTYGDLDALFTDLPTAAPPAPARSTHPAPTGGAPAYRGRHLRGAWAAWARVALVVTAIWLFTSLSGGFHPFWPIWVIGPWGAVLLSRSLGGGPRRGHGCRRW